MLEVLNRRTENSKDYDLGGGKFRREVTGQPQHYKDDYKDSKEAWKDIDLTIVNGRVDKAPYIMVIDGNKVTVTDKKTGQQSVVELLKVGTTAISSTSLSADSKSAEIIKDVDYDLVFNETKIKFQRTIKSAEALKEATFKITGDIPVVYSAVDSDGDKLEVQTTTDKSGNIVETFVAEKIISGKDGLETKIAPTYPIKIDPTLTIQGTGIDTFIYQAFNTTNYGTETYLFFNGASIDGTVRNILVNMSLSELPSGATISTATFSLYYYAVFGTSNPKTRLFTLYKVRRTDWHETQSTWDIYKTGNNWGTAGCGNTTTDIDTSLTATNTFIDQTAAGYWLDFDIKDIVEDAVANSVNFNIRGSIANGRYGGYFYSREYATDTSLRPKLVIEYTTGGNTSNFFMFLN